MLLKLIEYLAMRNMVVTTDMEAHTGFGSGAILFPDNTPETLAAGLERIFRMSEFERKERFRDSLRHMTPLLGKSSPRPRGIYRRGDVGLVWGPSSRENPAVTVCSPEWTVCYESDASTPPGAPRGASLRIPEKRFRTQYRESPRWPDYDLFYPSPVQTTIVGILHQPDVRTRLMSLSSLTDKSRIDSQRKNAPRRASLITLQSCLVMPPIMNKRKKYRKPPKATPDHRDSPVRK